MASEQAIIVGAAAACGLAGCVQRTISISSEPPGAMVWLNDREVGRTPVDVDFDYYGTYDVRLEHKDYEPLATSAKADAPWWDNVGIDLVVELVPATVHSRVEWHYVLEPVTDDRSALVQRAGELRSRLPAEADAEAATGAEQP